MKRAPEEPLEDGRVTRKRKLESKPITDADRDEAHQAMKDREGAVMKGVNNFEKNSLRRGPSNLFEENNETYVAIKRKVAANLEKIRDNSKLVAISAEELKQGASLAPVLSADNPDQEFRIMFMRIGSGDCILIQTPQGKVVVVDCGTRARPGSETDEKDVADDNALFRTEIRQHLKRFLGKDKTIALLLFTHPDKDHYCETKSIVMKVATKIGAIFHSTQLTNYAINNVYAEFKSATVVGQVTINGTVTMTTNLDDWKAVYLAPKNESRIRLLDEPNCKIWLLASEVPGNYGSAKGGAGINVNAASMITLIEVHGRKVLLTGDATHGTENFLLAKHRECITDIDLMQMEHHGSGTEHAAPNFVNTVNPCIAVASSGRHQSDLNPRWDTIARYIDYDGTEFHRDVTDAKRVHRLCKSVDRHGIRYGDQGMFLDPRAVNNFWNKDTKYRKYGLYTTDSDMNHLTFVVDKLGNLIRKWDDSTGSNSVTIAADGTVTQT